MQKITNHYYKKQKREQYFTIVFYLILYQAISQNRLVMMDLVIGDKNWLENRHRNSS